MVSELMSLGDEVKKIVAYHFSLKNISNLTRETTLISLGGDSFDLLDLESSLGDCYGISFYDFKKGKEINIGQLTDYVKLKYVEKSKK